MRRSSVTAALGAGARCLASWREERAGGAEYDDALAVVELLVQGATIGDTDPGGMRPVHPATAAVLGELTGFLDAHAGPGGPDAASVIQGLLDADVAALTPYGASA